MLKKHQTLRYIKDKTLNLLWEKFNPNTPWLSRQAIGRIEQLLNKSQIMVETGSGRSTIWYAGRVDKLISIEHYKPWYDKVAKQLTDAEVKNVEYIYAVDEPSDKNKSVDYIDRITNLPDKSIDVLLIDGVLRAEIANVGLPKVKKGGIIILDNAERYLWLDTTSPESIKGKQHLEPAWQTFEKAIAHLKRETYTDGITATHIIFI